MSRVTSQQKQVWSEHVKRQPRSNLSQRAYCEKHKINLRQFGYWKRVSESKATLPVKNASRPARANKFVPVQLTTRTSYQALTVTLANGVSITGIDENNLRLVSLLLGACE